MELVKENVIKKPGYNLHIIKTDKYKTNSLIWKMKAPLREETATYRALLSQILQSNTKSYPTTAALRSYLDELYGASFYTDLSKKGEFHILTFSLEIANEKFLQDKTPLLQKAVQFFGEVLLNPNATNQAFDELTMDKEKRTLKQRIQSVFDDKMRYASVRLVEEMCKGEPYAIQASGEYDKVDDITAASLFQYYQQAFSEDEMDFYIIGDVDVNQVESFCAPLQFEDRPIRPHERGSEREVTDIKEVKETQDIKQGKLNIGCRTNIVYGDPDYFALQMFNGIFGGFPHSKLFRNVREKESLAYYAASRVESQKGLLMIMSGIDNKKYDQALSIIKKQLELMKTGDITDEEINQTKAVIQNQFLETVDSARGLIEVLYHNIVAGTNVSLNDWLDKVKETTKTDIVEVAKKVKMDTVYFLAGTDGDQG
ncbi:EF-P 5-aminopentanol modification-associated protein YfmF [Lederbergia citrea]|uniref:Insulinase family protein n=1 Tax=Lederbergia citrea TaxID=2833581 RepID=A0A942UHR6_9BACI|nr:pitrilysin family protein [Lederbergia citrea]MBS4177057.1 insulinase family protein [Lederbergia citrea]MBS4203719.1 insulinase family protein [Lederbergia citrea]MBS4221695.1 insulinase family protein [Lederbergia citrea]